MCEFTASWEGRDYITSLHPSPSFPQGPRQHWQRRRDQHQGRLPRSSARRFPRSQLWTKRPPRSHPCLARAVAAALLPGAPTSSHLPLSHITAIRHPVRRIQFPPTFLNVSQSVSLSTPTSAPHLLTFNTSYHVNTIPVCPPQLLPPCYSISDSLMMIMMVVAIIIMITAPVYRVLSMCPELDQGP